MLVPAWSPWPRPTRWQAPLTNSLFTVAPPTTFDLTGQIAPASPPGTNTSGGTVLDLNRTAIHRASPRSSAWNALQAGLLSFGVLAAVLYTAAPLYPTDSKITRAAEKVTLGLLGLLVLFAPVMIEWVASLYITPPIPWSQWWLIPAFLLLFAALVATLWISGTLLISGLLDATRAFWKRNIRALRDAAPAGDK